MIRFSVGEEVLFEGDRYVVSQVDPASERVRLLATTAEGAQVVWTTLGRLLKIDAYTRAHDDTAGAMPRR
jgi:uncharacterized protein YigE (DUF2233 family)